MPISPLRENPDSVPASSSEEIVVLATVFTRKASGDPRILCQDIPPSLDRKRPSTPAAATMTRFPEMENTTIELIGWFVDGPTGSQPPCPCTVS